MAKPSKCDECGCSYLDLGGFGIDEDGEEYVMFICEECGFENYDYQ